jgi:hypothetical protein
LTALVNRITEMDETHRAELLFIRQTNSELLKQLKSIKSSALVTDSAKTLNVLNFEAPSISSGLCPNSKSFHPSNSKRATVVQECESNSPTVFELPSTSRVFVNENLNFIRPVPSSVEVNCETASSLLNTAPLLTAAPLIAATVTNKWISISKLNSLTTNNDVITYISKKLMVDGGSFHCSKITPRSIVNPSYASFKIGVSDELLKFVKSPSFWPVDVEVKDFVNNNKLSSNQNFHRAVINTFNK